MSIAARLPFFAAPSEKERPLQRRNSEEEERVAGVCAGDAKNARFCGLKCACSTRAQLSVARLPTFALDGAAASVRLGNNVRSG